MERVRWKADWRLLIARQPAGMHSRGASASDVVSGLIRRRGKEIRSHTSEKEKWGELGLYCLDGLPARPGARYLYGRADAIDTSMLRTSVSKERKKIMKRVCCVEGATAGARSKRRRCSCLVHRLGRKWKVERVHWPLERGTGGVFGDVVLGWRDMRASLFFEARGVGDPRIFGTGLGGKARGSTDDGGEVRRRCRHVVLAGAEVERGPFVQQSHTLHWSAQCGEFWLK